MVFSYVVRDYFTWHYLRAWKELFHVWLNMLWFIIHFFSIPELFHSLFAPWKRMTEERKQGFSFEDFAAFIIVNLLSRLLGATLRGTILVAGLTLLSAAIVIGACVFIFWLVAPLTVIASFIFGFSMLLSYATL
jgi:hypothetical protein